MGCVGSKALSPRASHGAMGRPGTLESHPRPGTSPSPAAGALGHGALSPRGGAMGGAGASTSALRSALPSSSRTAPGGVGLQGDQYVLKNGAVFPSVNTLAPRARAAFLQTHDPVNQLRLDDASVFYRVTERERIVDGALTGHPHAGARIRNHLALAENPYMPGSFKPAEMDALNLPDPALNVMFGTEAYEGVMNYATSEDRVAVMMTLGDLRAAGGGEVFLDVSARYGQDNESRALIVTLPQGASVPVTMLG